MPHHSRLAGFIIDCQGGDLGAAAGFWGAAMGLGVVDANEDGQDRYALLEEGRGGLHIEVQKVEHASRVHLDIETDDIPAEVARLAALGACEVSRPHDGRWVVMQAPTGQRFCVVRARTRLNRGNANRWD